MAFLSFFNRAQAIRLLGLTALFGLACVSSQAQFPSGPVNNAAKLVEVASGFSSPVAIVANPVDSHFYVVQQRGLVRILDMNPATGLGTILSTPFLNVSSVVSQAGNERGILGIAFPPDYASSGRFYIHYTKTPTSGQHPVEVARLLRNASNPLLGDASSREVLFSQPKLNANHNGGCIRFGPDGMLYVAMGDGGGSGDPSMNGQNTNTLLGKILRLDVSPTSGYTIPTTNPFAGLTGYKQEIWAYGVRNPWRFSFDKRRSDLWIADVGQNAQEEINFLPAPTPAPAASVPGGQGANLGWRCYEGTAPFNQTVNCDDSNEVFPVKTYLHGTQGCSVTGGFVYYGRLNPRLRGAYVYADYCSGRVWAIRRSVAPNGGNTFTTDTLGNFANYEIADVAEGPDNEIYLLFRTQGKIYRLVDTAAVGGIENCQSGYSVGESLAAQVVPGADSVRFLMKPSSGTSNISQVVTQAGRFVSMRDFAFPLNAIGNGHTLQVSYFRGGVWSAYSAPCNFTPSLEFAVPRLRLQDCGRTGVPLTGPQAYIMSERGPDSSRYRFTFLDSLGNVVFDTISKRAGLRLNPSMGLAPGSSYKVMVRVLVQGLGWINPTANDTCTITIQGGAPRLAGTQTVFEDEQALPLYFTLYPNPSPAGQGAWLLATGDLDATRVQGITPRVYDAMGRMVYSGQATGLRHSLPALPSVLYTVVIGGQSLRWAVE